MAPPPAEQFGKRRLPPLEPSSPVKRSGRVALLVMGTLAVGGGAYALMPHGNCDPNRPGVAASATSGQSSTACSSGRGGSSSRSSFYGGGSSSSHSSSGTSSESGSGPLTRGGFGGFAHAISAHFSGGG